MTKSAITLDELWQEEPVPRLEKPQHNTTHRKRHISKSTTFPTAAYQPYAKNNRKSPVSKQQFFSKKLAKKVQFSQKNGEIGQRSQTI